MKIKIILCALISSMVPLKAMQDPELPGGGRPHRLSPSHFTRSVLQAASKNNLNALKNLFESRKRRFNNKELSVLIRALNRKTQFPLHSAEDGTETRVLLAAGLRAWHRDHDEKTPMHYARSAQMVRELLEAGCSARLLDVFQRTPLFYAQTPAVADALIRAGANVNARDAEDNCPIHYAIDAEVAQALIDAGADINAINKAGKTPFETLLHTKEILLLLLQHNAVITVNRASYADYEEIIKEVVGDDFLAACFIGNNEYITATLKKTADPHALVNHETLGMTPLMAAISQGHPETARLLLEHITEVTPEHIALARKYRHALIELLLARHVGQRERLKSIPPAGVPALLIAAPGRVEAPQAPRQEPAPIIVELGHVGIRQTAAQASAWEEPREEKRDAPVKPDTVIQPAGSLPPHALHVAAPARKTGRLLVAGLTFAAALEGTLVGKVSPLFRAKL